MDTFETSKTKMAEVFWKDHHRAPWMDRWAMHGTGHSVTNCQYCTKLSICYWNANVSTPVFRSSSI